MIAVYVRLSRFSVLSAVDFGIFHISKDLSQVTRVIR